MRIRAVAVVIDGDEVLVINRTKGGKEYRVFPGGEPAWAKIRSLTGLVPETAREVVRAAYAGL